MSWGTACQTRLKTIRVKQNNCIRTIFFATNRENPTVFYNLLDILPLENIFNYKIGCLISQIVYKKETVPKALHGLICSAYSNHYYYTRYSVKDNLYRASSHTSFGLSRFKTVVSRLWEKIPISMKCLPYSTFKKKYKELLVRL